MLRAASPGRSSKQPEESELSQRSTQSLIPTPVRFPGVSGMAVAICALALGVRLFLFIHRYAVNVLFWDQWDFLAALFGHQPGFTDLLFWQHGPIREGIGLIADKYLFAWTGWNERVEAFAIGGFVFAAMVLALVLKRKLFGSFVIFDIAIPAMFLTLAQYESLIGSSNVAYSGLPLLMIVLYCLALLYLNGVSKYAAVLALNLLLIYTGFGVFMGIVSVGLFGLECYWSFRRRSKASPTLSVAALVIAIASLGSFFINYTWAPGVDCFQPPKDELWAYPWFMSLMLARFLGLKQGIGWPTVVGMGVLMGALLVFAIHVTCLLIRRPAQEALVGAVLISFSLLFSANTAIGRRCLGLPQAAQASRYVTLMIPAFLAMYFFLLSWKSGYRNLVLLLFVPLLVFASVPKTDSTTHWYADGKHAWAECYKKSGDIHACDQTTQFAIYPVPERTNLQQKLDFLRQHHLNLFADQP